jgi:hypothetical protein
MPGPSHWGTNQTVAVPAASHRELSRDGPTGKYEFTKQRAQEPGSGDESLKI